jgi:hypothetical protein
VNRTPIRIQLFKTSDLGQKYLKVRIHDTEICILLKRKKIKKKLKITVTGRIRSSNHRSVPINLVNDLIFFFEYRYLPEVGGLESLSVDIAG